jgi:hypothetical protein
LDLLVQIREPGRSEHKTGIEQIWLAFILCRDDLHHVQIKIKLDCTISPGHIQDLMCAVRSGSLSTSVAVVGKTWRNKKKDIAHYI